MVNTLRGKKQRVGMGTVKRLKRKGNGLKNTIPSQKPKIIDNKRYRRLILYSLCSIIFMSACLIALGVFAFLGIFSAKYRRWAREAFDCVGRRLTLRPCQTGFDDKVRAKVVSKLLQRNAAAARFTHKHFETLAWIFTILLFASLAYTTYSFYNLAVYGTCDPSDPGSCVFTVQHDKGPCVADNGTLSAAAHTCIPCLCNGEEIHCDAPEYQACGGNCACVEEMCRT